MFLQERISMKHKNMSSGNLSCSSIEYIKPCLDVYFLCDDAVLLNVKRFRSKQFQFCFVNWLYWELKLKLHQNEVLEENA